MHPDGLPDLFIDRSLGRIQVTALLRDHGLRLVTLAEHYGIPADEEIEDTTWLQQVGERGWVAFMKRRRDPPPTSEKQALVVHQVRAFCLSAGNLQAQEMADRFLRSLPAITAVCHDLGPFLCLLSQDPVDR